MRVVQDYIAHGLAGASAAQLDWETDDIALQNIQARVAVARRLDAGQPARRAAAVDQQPLRSGRRLRHDGRRHQRRAAARSPASTRPSCAAGCAWLETHGPSGLGAAARRWPPSTRRRPTAELRPPAAKPDRRSRPDAVRAARRHRAGRDPRQARAARSLPADARRSSRSTRRSSSPPGSSGSSASGAATSGSASATPRRSTSTTRTSIPRPGVVA